MSQELDLFGEVIPEAKPQKAKPVLTHNYAKAAATTPAAPWRPCEVHKLSRTEVMVVNSDYSHLFRR